MSKPKSTLSAAGKGFKKAKAKSVSYWKKKADAIFSEYIRRRDKGRCYTCPVRKDWKQMQNGHFNSRSRNATRYDERNCHCQGVECNVFKSGNMVVYAIRLQEQYGPNVLVELHREGNKIKQWTVIELQKLVETYKEKVAKLN